MFLIQCQLIQSLILQAEEAKDVTYCTTTTDSLVCKYIALRYHPNFELNISSCVVKSFSRNNKHELTQRQRRQHITPLVFNWHQRPCKRSLGVFADEIMFYPEPKEFELMLQCNKCVQNKLIRRVFHINTFFGNSKCAKWILSPWVNRN